MTLSELALFINVSQLRFWYLCNFINTARESDLNYKYLDFLWDLHNWCQVWNVSLWSTGIWGSTLHKAVLSLCTEALWLCCLQQPQPQCHPTTAMQGTATVLLKHELKHLLSGTYHAVIVKDMTEGLGFLIRVLDLTQGLLCRFLNHL